MKLTALEIKQQTFDKAIRGYDPAEVQAFLSLVSNEWEHLVTQQNELEKQIAALQEKLKHYERVESALHETLQTAKDSADQKLSGARQESRNILQKAELEAEEVIREAYDQRREVRQDIIRLLDRRKELIASIRSYLQNAQESLSQFSEETEGVLPPPPEETPRQRSRSAGQETGSNASPVENRSEAESSKPDGDSGPDAETKGSGEDAGETPEETDELRTKRNQDDPIDNILDQID